MHYEISKWKKFGQNAPESSLIIYRIRICWKVFFQPASRTAGISLKKFCTYDISSGILSREDVNGL